MTVWVFDVSRKDWLLAGCAISHAATVVEVEVIGFRAFEDTLVVAGPFRFNACFFKYDFWHMGQANDFFHECKL